MESENQAIELVSNAVADLEKAIKMAPDHAYAHYHLAAAKHRLMGLTQSMQLMESVKSMFDKAYKRFPSNAEGLVLYAMVRWTFVQYRACSVHTGYVLTHIHSFCRTCRSSKKQRRSLLRLWTWSPAVLCHTLLWGKFCFLFEMMCATISSHCCGCGVLVYGMLLGGGGGGGRIFTVHVFV